MIVDSDVVRLGMVVWEENPLDIHTPTLVHFSTPPYQKFFKPLTSDADGGVNVPCLSTNLV